MQEFGKILRDLVTPVAILAIMLALRPYVANIPIFQTTYLQGLPLILLGLAMILSWKFNRQQCFYLLLMVFIYAATLMLTQAQETQLDLFQTNLILATFAIFLPLNLLLFSAWKAPRVLSFAKLGHFIIIVMEVGVSFWLIENVQISITAYLYKAFLPSFILFSDLAPHIAVLLFMLAFILQGVKVSLKQDTVDTSQLIAIVAIFIGINFANLGSMNFLIFSAISIMLCIAIIQESFNMAFLDPLTRLPSRRAMNEELSKLGKSYTIAMLDIDHFKKINDTYGHDVGDQVLRKLAKHLQRISGGGHASRYGGEEFAVIFPGKSIAEVSHHLELLRENIASASFTVRNIPRPKTIPKNKEKQKTPHKAIKVTVSIGVAERNRLNRKTEDVQKAADSALYKAKKTGRNKICY